MSSKILAVCLALLPAVSVGWPWSRDMMNQISVKPEHGPDSIRLFPQRSVPMAGTKVLIHLHDADAAAKLLNPNPPTVESVQRGKKFYQVFCTPCHGQSGTGDGLVGEKFLIRPFDLTAENEQVTMPVGYIFGKVMYGDAIMPGYGNDMSPSEIWDVVNYVRHGLVSDSAALAAVAAIKKP